MSAPAETVEPAATSSIPSGPGLPNINPATGLSTDYLNHFTEAITTLEMASSMPECLEDLRLWRPKTYVEHFESSRFCNRDVIIGAYRRARSAVRDALDAASKALNAWLSEMRDAALRLSGAHPIDAKLQTALRGLRPLVARTAALINGAKVTNLPPSVQTEIDAMFSR